MCCNELLNRIEFFKKFHVAAEYKGIIIITDEDKEKTIKD